MDTPETAKSSLRDIFYVIFKRKFHITLFFVCAVLAGAFGTYSAQPIYEASSQILIKIGRENFYVPLVTSNTNSNPLMNPNRDEQLLSEIEILKSQSLAQKVVQSLGPNTIYKEHNGKGDNLISNVLRRSKDLRSPADKAILRLGKSLKVERIRESDVIDVSFKHGDPRMAAAVVNQLVHLYVDQHLQVHKNSKSYEFFQEQSKILKERLEQSERGLKVFKEQHGLTSIEEERRLLLGQEADHRAALNQTLSQEAETEQRIRQLRHQLAVTPKTIPQGEQMGHNPLLINTLQARLVELELKEKELLTKYTEQSRLVRNVKDEIGLVREKLAEHEGKRYESSSLGLNPTYQRLQEDLLKNEAELKALAAKKDTQKSQFFAYKKKLVDLNRLEVELNRLKSEVEINKKNYHLYLTKFEESRISKAMDAEKITNVSVIEPARPPLKPVTPKVLQNLLLAFLFGVFGGFGLAFFLEYLDDSLEKPEDAERALDLPVLASIPVLRK